jgi:hypothetical protein
LQCFQQADTSYQKVGFGMKIDIDLPISEHRPQFSWRLQKPSRISGKTERQSMTEARQRFLAYFGHIRQVNEEMTAIEGHDMNY